MHGYAGKILRVDLSSGVISDEPLAENVAREWVGGTGLGVQYLYQEVAPEINWDDPRNKVMLATGPLAGTRIHGSGTFSVVTKGAQTNGGATTQANGFLGAYLKFCGYDGVYIEGASDKWVYLYIHEGGAELRDASHLLGQDAFSLQETIKGELGLSRSQASVFGIGPAGEHLVRFAAIVGDHGHVAAHNGVGAVLGSKKVKAIAVARGQGRFPLYDRDKLSELGNRLSKEASEIGFGPSCYNWGTNEGFGLMYPQGSLPVKNLQTNIFPEYERFNGRVLRNSPALQFEPEPCWACNWHHCHRVRILEGPFTGFQGEEPEYEGLAAATCMTGQTDPLAGIMLSNIMDMMGLDCNESGWLISWVMECYEKGYLTKGDLDGLEMTWGNVETTRQLLHKIAHREGCGAWLADGLKTCAEKLGGEAQRCAVYTLKGANPRSHDHRAVWTELLDICVSSTGTIESTGGVLRPQQHGLEPMTDRFSWEQVANQNAKTNGRRLFEDSLGICRWPNEDFHLIVAAVNAATGWDLDHDTAMAVGKRAANQLKVFNLLCGLTKELDQPSERYSSVPVDGPTAGVNIRAVWWDMVERYYELMGWERETGRPLPETLTELGLEYLVPRIWSRGACG